MMKALASEVLRDALRGLSPVVYALDPQQLAPLQEMVCGVVDELKATGMTPERVLLSIKEIATSAGVPPTGQRLVEQLISWCLERYFQKPEASNP